MFPPGQRNNAAIGEVVEKVSTKELVTWEATCAWEEQDRPEKEMKTSATKLN